MNFIFIYLMGALLGYGISYTAYDFVVTHDDADLGSSKMKYVFFGALLSWVTVAIFLWGVLSGILKQDDTEDGE